jgi:hypothetical protein
VEKSSVSLSKNVTCKREVVTCDILLRNAWLEAVQWMTKLSWFIVNARYRIALSISKITTNTRFSIPLTFEVLTPLQVCASFSRALTRPVRYIHGPIDIKVPLPKDYHEHLTILEEVLGKQRAPYYGPTMYYPHEAIRLWEGNRGMEEYAAETFIVEEKANGQTWMGVDEDEDGESVGGESAVGTPFGSAAMTPGSMPDRTSLSYFMGSC